MAENLPQTIKMAPPARMSSPDDLTPPQTGAHNYQVGREIARGGMGSVLEAEDTKLKRTVAVKVMLQDSDADAEMRRRFIHEAEVLAALAHPDIVPIYDIVWEDGLPLFYSMKRINGRTLQQILDGLAAKHAEDLRQFTLDRLLLVFRKVCDAIAFAHSKGFIHRDLKPENVMVGEFGEVLVMDWGLAKRMRDEGGRMKADAEGVSSSSFILPPSSLGSTLEGSVMGTPQYMSPEQARGEIDALDERSDIYSLGGILYAILTLRPPVEGKSVEEVLKKVTAAQITSPSALPAGAVVKPNPADPREKPEAGSFTPPPRLARGRVPEALSAVAMKALRLDKASRYQNVLALGADIEAYQNGFATDAEDAGLFTQIALLVRRRKRESAIIAAALLALVSSTTWFVMHLRASERVAVAEAGRATKAETSAVEKGETARQALARAQIALADAAFHNADVTAMTQALESCPPDLRDQGWQYLSAKRDASESALVNSRIRAASAVVALPGKPGCFAIAGRAKGVEIVDAVADRVLRSLDTGMRGSKGLAVSADGRVLAVVGRDAKARLFDVESGEGIKEFDLPFDADVVALNPDASRIAVTSLRFETADGCAMLDTADGRVLWWFRKRVQNVEFTPDGARVVTSSSGTRRLFNLLRADDGRQIAEIAGGANCQAVSRDGKWIALGSTYGDILLVDGRTGALLGTSRPFNGEISAVAFTADGQLLAAGDQGKFRDNRWVFRLLDPRTLRPVATFFGLKPGPNPKWSLQADTGELLTLDNPPRRWRIPVGRELVKFSHEAEQAWGGCFLSDTLMCARKEFGLELYDLSKTGSAVPMGAFQNFRTCDSHWSSGTIVMGAVGVKDGKRLGIGLRMLAFENGQLVEKKSFPFEGQVPQVVFAPSGERFAAFSKSNANVRGNRIEIMDSGTGATMVTIPGGFSGAVFTAAGRTVVAVKNENRTGTDEVANLVIAFDAQDGAEQRRTREPFRIGALAASPDGSLIAIAGSDQCVHLLDAATLAEKSVFRAHDSDITALAFHPKRPVLATAAMDRSVKLWEYESAKLAQHFLGLGGTPVVLAFSPNGRLLLVDGQEQTTRVFEVGGGAGY